MLILRVEPSRPGGRAIAWAMNEAGIAYQVRVVKHGHPGFLAHLTRPKPFSEMFLCLEDGELAIHEVNTAITHVARRYAPSLLGDDVRVEEWLAFWKGWHGAGQFGLPQLHEAIHRALGSTPESEAAIETARQTMRRLLVVFEPHLAANPYVAGTQFTLADICAADSVLQARAGGVDLTPFEAITRWLATVCARPGFPAVA